MVKTKPNSLRAQQHRHALQYCLIPGYAGQHVAASIIAELNGDQDTVQRLQRLDAWRSARDLY